MAKATILAVSLSLLASTACSASTPSTEGGPLATTNEALATNGMGVWSTIPGVGGGVFFKGRPTLLSHYTDARNRDWSVCATAYNNNVYCTSRLVLGGMDYGWQAWSAISPPPGVTLGASSPALTSWTDNYGHFFYGLAARQSGGTCSNCLWLQVQQPGTSSTWYQVPNSGLASGYTGDVSLAMNQGKLYVFAISGNGNPYYYANYTSNNVLTAYSNSGWNAWQAVPGGGLLGGPVIATTMQYGILISAEGGDQNPYTQQFNGVWNSGWSLVTWGSFKDSPSVVSFTGTGNDQQVFGLGTDNVEYQGDWNTGHTYFDGWWNFSSNTFFSSPAASFTGGNHVDLAALANTQLVQVTSYDKPASCSDGSIEQTFADGAVGCAGSVSWANRNALCGAGSHACTAAQWVADRNGAVPTHIYWTDDNLLYSGGGSGTCSVSTTSGNACTGEPMRVCPANGHDPEGNACNWTNCGYGATSPNQYFGGCYNEPNAGTLCCTN